MSTRLESAERALVEEINSRQTNSDKDILDSLTGAIDRLQKAFPRYGSFIMEFIQNSDDAQATVFQVEILKDKILIANNGRPFCEDDVRSICKVGRSSKTPKDYIGYLGVGFKSSFLISDCVEIFSGRYNFKFDRNYHDDPAHIPWQVIPVWSEKEAPQLSSAEKVCSTFLLHPKDSKIAEAISEEVSKANLNSRLLLFLRNIEKLVVFDHERNERRILLRKRIFKGRAFDIFEIEENVQDRSITSTTCNTWVTFRHSVHVPEQVRNNYATRDWERHEVLEREIAAAFRLEAGSLIQERSGTAHVGVFSFLPLKEVPSGLPFLIQADFLTQPGRGDLAKDVLWNTWLSGEILKLLVEKCIPEFLQHDVWKWNFTKVMCSERGGNALFETLIKSPLRNYVESEPLLIAQDGSFTSAQNALVVGKEFLPLISSEDVSTLFAGRKILHEKCEPFPSRQIQVIHDDIFTFLTTTKADLLLEYKAHCKDIAWFAKLLGKLTEKYDIASFASANGRKYKRAYDQFWNGVRTFEKPIIPTEDFTLARIRECKIENPKISIPDDIKRHMKFVHPALVKTNEFAQFVARLNGKRFHSSRILTSMLSLVKQEEVLMLAERQKSLELTLEKWTRMGDTERISVTRKLMELWSVSPEVSLSTFGFLTVKTKEGEWVEPEKVVFSKEYGPEHNIEAIVHGSLLDFPIDFLSPDYLLVQRNGFGTERRKWIKFFQTLGVDRFVEGSRLDPRKGGIVHRVGILASLAFERNRNRNARELGESEQFGYDIESKGVDESQERFIEVKATGSLSHDIFLTVNEFRTLRAKQERYYIYVVLDCFRHPHVKVVEGEKLLEIQNTKLVVPYNEWNKLSIDGQSVLA